MKVIFSHGKESGPWGRKIKAMAHIAKLYDLDIESIDYSETLDPELRVKKLTEVLENERGDIILVGSSMGGYVSTVAASQFNIKGLFLLAPALYMPAYTCQAYSVKCDNVEIIHGWGDTVIPHSNSLKFAAENNYTLTLINGDHSLNSSLAKVTATFKQFIERVIS